MALLEKYVQPDELLLDIGCGSGLLSIAALKLGAPHAVAVDVDGAADLVSPGGILLLSGSFEHQEEEIC